MFAAKKTGPTDCPNDRARLRGPKENLRQVLILSYVDWRSADLVDWRMTYFRGKL